MYFSKILACPKKFIAAMKSLSDFNFADENEDNMLDWEEFQQLRKIITKFSIQNQGIEM